MALKKANVNVQETAAPKSDIPVINIPGTLVSRFNAADAKAKDAKAALDEVRPEIVSAALCRLLKHNVENPTSTIDSIKLEDTTGSQVRMSFTSKYKQCDGEAADAAFNALNAQYPDLNADINDFAQETVAASFDNKVFLDSNGNFDEAIFAAFSEAMATVAKRFNKANPLSTKKVVLPKDSFHTARWTKFANVEQQKALCEALPNTIQVVAGKYVPVAVPAPETKAEASRETLVASSAPARLARSKK